MLPPDLEPVTPASFQADPVRHPIAGGSGPNANQYASGVDYGQLPTGNNYREQPAPATVPDAPAGARSVRVREGDTLEKIARRELGNGGRWQEIAQLNGIHDPRKIKVGQALLLPGTGGAAPAAAPASIPAPAAATPAERSYTVQNGDTLSKISQQVYGTSKHWQRIQEHNGIRDARSLKAGQTLRIPPLP